MILVTGAGGFLGKKLVLHLKSLGFNVVSLYHHPVLKIEHDSWSADLTRHDHVRDLIELSETPSIVIHLAGLVDISLRRNPESLLMPPIPDAQNIFFLYLNNVVGTANVLDYCLRKGVKKIIYASSQTVYGFPDGKDFIESLVCEPLEHYATSKFFGEQLLRVGSRQGVAVTVLRFPGLYSEDRREGIVYRFCMSALEKSTILVDPKFPLPFDVIHVDDVVDAFGRATKFSNQNYICLNIATGLPCSLDILADSIAELVPHCEVKYSEVPQPIVCMDSSKAKSVLGWSPAPRRKRLLQLIERFDCTSTERAKV